MRRVLYVGRLCLQQTSKRPVSSLTRYAQHHSSHRSWPVLWPRPPKPFRTGAIALSLLSPTAFVALSEEESGDGKTPEEHMLEASRAEIAKRIPDNIYGWKRAWRSLCLGVDLYIWEPVATTLRFLHLIVIFIPVLATIPMIWVGHRQKDRDHERSGTFWWYGFLVHSMERAGPAFIKVHENLT